MNETNVSLRRALRLGFFMLVIIVVGMLSLDAFMPTRPRRPQPAAGGDPNKSRPQHKTPAKTVLRSTLAERSWYPSDANLLRKQLAGFFEKAGVEPLKNAVALILPHAGYAYSGQTAAYGLKTIKGNYSRIVILGPSHYVPMSEILSVPKVTHYRTPLGEVPLDTGFIAQLLEHPVFQSVPRVHRLEHSVQIELPLLQYAFGDFKFVPIVAGQCSAGTIRRAAAVLKPMLDAGTLVIASSDFTHYGPNYGYVPFTENIPEQLKKLDMGAFEKISALDADGFLAYRQKTRETICGYVPIALLLSMLNPDSKCWLVHYATSGTLTGDFTNSVSYLAVVFTGPPWAGPGPAAGRAAAAEPKHTEAALTADEKDRLLKLARKTIDYYFEHRRIPTASQLGIDITGSMKSRRAAFVTLTEHGMLRGCIGDIFPRQPLYESVLENAVNACVRDPRFRPVTKDELAGIKIEISALTVPKPIDSWRKIKIGTDGVVLSKADREAVFLPQVAPEQGWDVSEMLTHLSIKAGLEPNAWKQGAEFLAFQAEVFGEKQ